MFGRLFRRIPARPADYFHPRHAGDVLDELARAIPEWRTSGFNLGGLHFYQLYQNPPSRSGPRPQAALVVYAGGFYLLYISPETLATLNEPLRMEVDEQQHYLLGDGLRAELEGIGLWIEPAQEGDIQTAQWLGLSQMMADHGLMKAEDFGLGCTAAIVHTDQGALGGVLLFPDFVDGDERRFIMVTPENVALGAHFNLVHPQQVGAYQRILQSASQHE